MLSRLSSISSPLTSFLPSLLRSSPTSLLRSSPILQKLAPASFSTSSALQFNSRLTSPHNFPQPRREEPDPFLGRQEMAKDGYGVTLFDINDGKRKSLSAVVMRFKRLDWGAWIRPKAGRNKKMWKKSLKQQVVNERHVFCKSFHKRRFDRAVTSDIKEIRHIPDDPYKVYNDMSYQHYRSIKMKNMELIKKYGAKNYNFPQFKAHYRKNVTKTDKPVNPMYEPPGYHADIASGIYQPDSKRPQDEMPPDYLLERRDVSKAVRREEDRYFRKLRRGEHWYGRLGPCSPMRLPLAGTKLG